MPNGSRVHAGPTKAFFVKMLTRDIELADSILDLLDNCVDGVIRTLKADNAEISKDKPYHGYWAHITMRPDQFEIQDNCGGIPKDIAINSAFMLGRPDADRDADIETVGMYGIGMKRAMFKMGKHSVVKSQPKTGPFKVEILPEWLQDDETTPGSTTPATDPWVLQLVSLGSRLEHDGTVITIRDLRDEISFQFDPQKSSFIADLKKEIARHYALIIEKGFSVTVNGEVIKPVPLTIFSPVKIGVSDHPAIEPYLFTGGINGVQVDLAVGFYRKLATESELENEDFVRSTSENAGWTIICNDRVVLYNDKTFRTGWGTKGITPGYHNQFISIRGIVSFRSKHSMELPLNTTKRGLATDSVIYQQVIDQMRAGLKQFTSFTNKWKRAEEETSPFYKPLSQRKLDYILSHVDESRYTQIRAHPGHRCYYPTLPKPEPQQKQTRICFPADKEDIETVANYYFEDPNHDKVEVGRRCFDESLRRAKRGKD